jgi:hypothetical protein
MAVSQTQEAAREFSGTLLAHQSFNQDSNSTILFIHGAFVDSNDWDLVVPYVLDYHLLLPDCPGHGRSSHIPFSIEASAEHVAHLVEAKAMLLVIVLVPLSLFALPRTTLMLFAPYSSLDTARLPFPVLHYCHTCFGPRIAWKTQSHDLLFAGSWMEPISPIRLVLHCRFVDRSRILAMLRRSCSRGLHEL